MVEEHGEAAVVLTGAFPCLVCIKLICYVEWSEQMCRVLDFAQARLSLRLHGSSLKHSCRLQAYADLSG